MSQCCIFPLSLSLSLSPPSPPPPPPPSLPEKMMVDHPFTETQLKELELQTLIFNYLASGIPIPAHLIAHLRRSFYFLDQYPSMSIGRRAEEDPEPWRCKRTDGKKWRCSKEAFQDSKYCERHMQRGKKSSRKLVELPAASSNTHLFLGSPSHMMAAEDHKSHRSECYNFFSEEKESSLWFKEEEERRRRQRQHCYVLGTDLMSQKPAVRVDREPKPLLCLFNECAERSKMTSRADPETQLSISIP